MPVKHLLYYLLRININTFDKISDCRLAALVNLLSMFMLTNLLKRTPFVRYFERKKNTIYFDIVKSELTDSFQSISTSQHSTISQIKFFIQIEYLSSG